MSAARASLSRAGLPVRDNVSTTKAVAQMVWQSVADLLGADQRVSPAHRTSTMKTATILLLCATAVLGWPKSQDQQAVEKVHFELSTRENPDDPVILEATATRESLKHFDPYRPTKIVVHGWHSGPNSHLRYVKTAFLEAMDVNVILVNWRSFDSIFYPRAVQKIRPVARTVGTLVDSLVLNGGAKPEDIHIIGHSLGAHIAGLSSLYTASGPVNRITGLDPAGPLIRDDPYYRLDKKHAPFVDVIHTCANVFGFRRPLGHVDFYPNGGRCIQPGCEVKDLTSGKCSHNRAYYLFRETIVMNNTLLAVPTKPYEGSWPCQEDDRSAEMVPMGLNTPRQARGVYCLPTRPAEPFGYGQEIPEEIELEEQDEIDIVSPLMIRKFLMV